MALQFTKIGSLRVASTRAGNRLILAPGARVSTAEKVFPWVLLAKAVRVGAGSRIVRRARAGRKTVFLKPVVTNHLFPKTSSHEFRMLLTLKKEGIRAEKPVALFLLRRPRSHFDRVLLGYVVTEKMPGKPLAPEDESTYTALAVLKERLTRKGVFAGRDFGPHHVFKNPDGKLGLIDVELFSHKKQARVAF